MTTSTTSLEAKLCTRLVNHLSNGEEVFPEQLWPLCRVLAKEGLALSNNEEVAAIQIGPFRAATLAGRADAIECFVESLFPTAVEFLMTGGDLKSFINGSLTFATELFCACWRKGTLVRDEFAWKILISIKQENREGRSPTISQIVAKFSAIEPVSEDEIRRRVVRGLMYLEQAKSSLSGSEIPLVHMNADQAYISLV